MNGTQLLITISYSILVVASLAGVVYLILTTRRRGRVDQHTLEAGENRWGVVVTVMLVALLALTIFSVPYGDTKAPAGAQKVRVVGQQFAWAISPNSVRAGEPVQFILSSRDVQHGFGVYDGNKLLFQVQVPAKGEPDQLYTHTFSRPGVYEVNCLEFCGYQHHVMRGVIRVT